MAVHLTLEDYTLAWICSSEQVGHAAVAMLDKVHELPALPPNDTGKGYTVGSIADIPIIILQLDDQIDSAVTRLRQTFTSLEDALLITLGTGLHPSIRPGDVVIGAGTFYYGNDNYYHRNSAVMFFESTNNGQNKCVGALPAASRRLTKASRLLFKREEDVREDLSWDVKRIISGENDCDQSHENQDIPSFHIHHGLIASGHFRLKEADPCIDPTTAAQFGLQCLEDGLAMHLRDLIPYSIVQGIVDVQWERPAAAAAVACAKQLVLHTEAPDDYTPRPKDRTCRYSRHWRAKAILYEPQYLYHNSRRYPGTGKWLLSSESYQTWIHTPGQTLSVWGPQGAGKTKLTSAVIEDVTRRFENSYADGSVGIAYVFADARCRYEQTVEHLFASVLKQLNEKGTPLDSNPHYSDWWDDVDLAVLRMRVEDSSRVFIILDGVNELDPQCRVYFLQEMDLLKAKYGVNILLTSSAPISKICHCDVQVEISTENADDIYQYVRGTVNFHMPFLQDADKLSREITKIADGR